MKPELIKDFNLPSYVKGKSFADASKAIEKKFSERTDIASKETKEELMGRLAKAQEHVKMQESLASNSQEVPDMMNGQVPEGFEEFGPQQGQNQMFSGGRVPVQSVGNVTPNGIKMEDPLNGVVAGDTSGLTAPGAGKSAGAGVSAGAIAGMAGTAMELGQTAFGDTGIDTSGASGRGEAGSIGGGVASGAMKGASAGAALGPWGAAAGAVVGGGLGAIGAGKAQKEQLKANMNSDAISNNKFTNDFAYGGFDPTDPRKKVKAVDTTGIVNDSIYPITPVGGVENFTPKGIETPKRNGSAQAAYLESVEYAGRKPAKPGQPYNHSGSAAGIFDNEQTQVPRQVIPKKQPTGEPYNHSGSVAGIFDNEQTQVPRDPGYDFYNDPNQVLKGQAKAKETVDYLTSVENKGTKAKGAKAVEQRAKVEGIGMKSNPFDDSNFKNNSKSVIDGFAKEYEQGVARNAKIKEMLAEHQKNKPKGSKLDAAGLAEFAPAAMSAFQLGSIDRPTRESLDRLDSRYKTNYVDEKALENRVQNEHNNVSRSLAGASNGSMGALRANLLGANKNKTSATSEAFLRADDINRQEDRAAQQFNSRNDMINLRQSNAEKENAARDEGAYKTNRSMLRSTLADNVGSIGRETSDRKTIAKMFGYDVKGEYVVGKDGKKKTWKEFDEEIKAYKKNSK